MQNLKLKIPAYLYDKFEVKFAKTVKKLAGLNFELKIVNKTSIYEESAVLTVKVKTDTSPFVRTVPQTILIYMVEVNIPTVEKQIDTEETHQSFTVTVQADKYVKTGFEFIGTVANKLGIMQTFQTVKTDTILQNLIPSWKMECAHCNVTRNRVKYFVFRNIESTKFFTIGSTCVKEYFGLNVERMLKIFEKDLTGYTEEYMYGNSPMNTYNVSEFIENGVYHALTSNHWDRQAASEFIGYSYDIACASGSAKKSMIAHYEEYQDKLATMSDEIAFWSGELLKQAESIYSRVKQNDTTVDSFDTNFMNLLLDEDRNVRIVLPIIGLSIAWRIFDKISKDRKAKQSEIIAKSNGISTHIGELKERIVIGTANIVFETTGDGMFGTWYLYKFVDTNGNVFSWFASKDQNLKVGDEVSMKGTVKSHGVYNGEKYTQLNRCKFTPS